MAFMRATARRPRGLCDRATRLVALDDWPSVLAHARSVLPMDIAHLDGPSCHLAVPNGWVGSLGLHACNLGLLLRLERTHTLQHVPAAWPAGRLRLAKNRQLLHCMPRPSASCSGAQCACLHGHCHSGTALRCASDCSGWIYARCAIPSGQLPSPQPRGGTKTNNAFSKLPAHPVAHRPLRRRHLRGLVRLHSRNCSIGTALQDAPRSSQRNSRREWPAPRRVLCHSIAELLVAVKALVSEAIGGTCSASRRHRTRLV